MTVKDVVEIEIAAVPHLTSARGKLFDFFDFGNPPLKDCPHCGGDGEYFGYKCSCMLKMVKP